MNTDKFDLGWHAEWLPAHAKDRAGQAFVDMCGFIDNETRDENGVLLWERAELTLAGEVFQGMAGIEDPAFVTRAQVAALTIFRQRLHLLSSTSLAPGSA